MWIVQITLGDDNTGAIIGGNNADEVTEGNNIDAIIEEAEKKVNHTAYTKIGFTATSYSSKIIYEDNNDYYIVWVKFSISDDSDDFFGACCVKVKSYGDTAVAWSTTSIMAPEYDFEKHLDELKAQFTL